MLAATLFSVLSAVAAATPTLLTRAPFPVDAIPDVCSTPCETYKSVFSPDASADARATACQGGVFEQFNICMNCTSIEGVPNGMTSEQVQLLSLAVQQMGQECIESHYTSQYAGEIPAPTSLPKSSSTSLAPTTNATKPAVTSTSANPFASSASASASASASGAAAAEGKSSAGSAGASLSAALVAVGALALSA